ncbi:bifunctional serine/threonine-protein kinase/ABC transporter substrate-binding protein [Streptomyces sp. CAU 1734]|uniref:bifunctional serine/threonine-protein kinase/ABC transporter substrate-binding protein n=1 Tax=Streptomyces sp. CAU 1734 TaxID=3140360 RepID=UPI00326168D8
MPERGPDPAGSVQRLLPSDPSAIAGYRLLGRLGAGGMGVVYLGRTEAGELAAVKVTLSGQADDPDFRARFRREVEAARRVSSPWAVPVTGADPEAPEPWMATAFVPGPSIAEAVAAHGPLPVRSVRILGVAIARALAAVHAAGLVHRDVKPGNVLLAVDGPRLIDFGIARTTGESALTSTDMVVGTPGFLAPEQAEARGAEIGPPSDVFALGCLLAYTVTGRLPFGRGAVDALLYRTVHDAPDLRGIEGDMAALLAGCLAKDPAARPTADQVAERLAEDEPRGADWLPPEVVRTIAERSARMLALPDIDLTRGGKPGPAATGAGRRRVLLLSGAAVLAAAGGGAALWAGLSGSGGSAGSPRKRDWVIGVQADLTGPQKRVGAEQERGARLAVDAFNARADRPFSFALRTADDRGDTIRATAVAREMAEDRDITAVLGSTGDYTTQAVRPLYEEALLPLISVSAGLNLLTAADNRAFNRTISSHPEIASQLAYSLQRFYSLRLKRRKARPGLIQDRTDDEYSWQYTVRFNQLMQTVYGHHTLPRVVPASVEDYGPVVDSILDARADAFLHSGGPRTTAKVAKLLRERKFDGPMLAGGHALDPEFLKEAGEAAEGWTIGAPVGDPTALATARPFAAAYRKKYGTAPGYYAGEAFDAVNMMIEEVVGAAGGGKRPSRETLAGALRDKTYDGVMGYYRFDPKAGGLTGLRTHLHGVKQGRFTYIGTAPTEDPGRWKG